MGVGVGVDEQVAGGPQGSIRVGVGEQEGKGEQEGDGVSDGVGVGVAVAMGTK
jgi:hypothetical protein